MKALINPRSLSAAVLSAVLLGVSVATPRQASSQDLDDSAITAKIESELLDGEGIWSSDIIRVETVQSVVYLRGYAASEHNRQRAGEIAESIAGVKGVENNVRVR